jgi:glycosyl-4,4'-diaponeurosporenoate acyltransferase
VLVELSIPAIIVLNIVAWAAIQLGLAWGLTQLSAAHFNPASLFARARHWESKGRIYERLFRIKSWKDKLPDGAAWFVGGVSKAQLPGRSAEAFDLFACEAWRGEVVHWLAMMTLPLFCIWNPWWAVGVNAVYAVLANLPCILVLRYNRARLRWALDRSAGESQP